MQHSALTCYLLGLAAEVVLVGASSGRFLPGDSVTLRTESTQEVFEQEIRHAVKSALGCGGAVSPDHIESTKSKLRPMWDALPKNTATGSGQVDRRALRYLGHRYFMHNFGISVRGFEPTRAANETQAGVVEMLNQRVASYMETALESLHSPTTGYSLEDVVHLIVMLEKLIMESQHTLLEHIYKENNMPGHELLSLAELRVLLDSYLIHWVIGEEIHTEKGPYSMFHDLTFLNTEKAAEYYPDWPYMSEFVRGQLKTFQWERQQTPWMLQGHTKNTWTAQYSFEDANEIVSRITRSFASFWGSDCRVMKEALVALDSHKTGRVSLSRFYAESIENQQRFVESAEYLREIGALDETSTIWGPQVIIPNYVQSPANCIISTAHYMVCCSNECEVILGEIETALESPFASPAEILSVVGNLTVQTTLEDDGRFQVDQGLLQQLEQIASGNGGHVNLHGRLFMQWLHFAFPQDCPFPHKTGNVAYATPREYGNASFQSLGTVVYHALDPVDMFGLELLGDLNKDKLQWMSQWSEEEELAVEVTLPTAVTPLSSHLTAGSLVVIQVLILIAVLTGVGLTFQKSLVSRFTASPTRSFYI